MLNRINRDLCSSMEPYRLLCSSLGSFTERHLKCIWFDSSLRPEPLQTYDGDRVIVEHPGRWNLGPGPDFLGATIYIEPSRTAPCGNKTPNRKAMPITGPVGRRVSGDVEIHVAASDWQRHGHTSDQAYCRVMAHVTYSPGYLRAGVLPKGAVQISLKEALMTNPLFSFEAIDVSAYPFCAPVRPTQCGTVLANANAGQLQMLFEAAGQERIRRKSERMTLIMREKGQTQTLYEEIMAALGYKNNQNTFRRLAVILPVEALREESSMNVTAAYALLLGVAGLLPCQIKSQWDAETRSFIRGLWQHWWKYQSKWEERALNRQAWNMKGVRPQNHPRRRLMAAALLFCGPRDIVRQIIQIPANQPRRWMDENLSLLQPGFPTGCYWDYHLSLSGKRRPARTAIMGRRRAAAMISNVIVPFIASARPGAITIALLRLLRAEEDNAIIRQTAYALLGPDHNPSLYRTGLCQQGLIQIFYDFCLHDTGCASCALPERVKRFLKVE